MLGSVQLAHQVNVILFVVEENIYILPSPKKGLDISVGGGGGAPRQRYLKKSIELNWNLQSVWGEGLRKKSLWWRGIFSVTT